MCVYVDECTNRNIRHFCFVTASWNRLHTHIGTYRAAQCLSLFGDTDGGKAARRSVIDITQTSFRESKREAHREVAVRQAGRQAEKGLTGTNRDKEGRKLAGRDRCGACSSRDRWEGREKTNNEEVLAPSAAREWNMLSPFRWERRGSQRYMQQHTHNPLWMVSVYMDCVSVCARVCMCVFCSKCACVCVCWGRCLGH